MRTAPSITRGTGATTLDAAAHKPSSGPLRFSESVKSTARQRRPSTGNKQHEQVFRAKFVDVPSECD